MNDLGEGTRTTQNYVASKHTTHKKVPLATYKATDLIPIVHV